MRENKRNIFYGLYNDETELLSAVKEANKEHLDIYDVYTPFPVHGLDPLLGLSESRLHIVGFIFGVTGLLLALLFMTWTLAIDWPIIYGGKPYWPIAAFIPITFELTVLFAAVSMVVTFYVICGLGPGVDNPTLDDRITDDKFCIAFDTGHLGQHTIEDVESFFRATKAAEVNHKTLG